MFDYDRFGKKGAVMRSLARLSIIFFIISFIGWCFEKFARYLVYNSLSDRGFLAMPICPIYGVSILLIYLIADTQKTMKPALRHGENESKIKKVAIDFSNFVIYFLLVTLISTAIEFVTGIFFDKLLGVRLWTYENQPLNIGGYICLKYSLLWGVLISLFMSTAWEKLYSAVKKVRDGFLNVICIVLWSALICDLVFNFIYIGITGTHFNIF